jgi:hypothetical protein
MSETDKLICGRHGETVATFMCRHLVLGAGCGYHADTDPAKPWPDAWCDLCDELLAAAGGEWTDEAGEQADVRALCTHCYEDARARNQAVPPLARGAAARLTEEECRRFLHDAVHQAQARQDGFKQTWPLDDMARWDFDSDAMTITFTDPTRPGFTADVLLVGSYSTRSETFQWAWQTSGPGGDSRAIGQLREFGEVRGIEQLTTPTWKAEVADGWEMAAVAALLLPADAFYRAPFDHLYWFMLLTRPRP